MFKFSLDILSLVVIINGFPRSDVGRAKVEAFLLDKMPPALVTHRLVRIRTMIEVKIIHASLLVDLFRSVCRATRLLAPM